MSAKQIVMAAAGASGPVNYIEDVFSTYIYTGNGGTQTITNGIDLAGKGGLVWIKARNWVEMHMLYDTNRGVLKKLSSDRTDAEQSLTGSLTAFNSNGFSLGSYDNVNLNSYTFTSWTFRKQPKFFDVVTWTGNGANRTISHNLGAVPGCIFVKRTDTAADWQVYHRANTANPETDYLVLNTTAATADSDTRWNDTLPTSTVFSLGTDATVNANGGTYVAYLFAHDAGGFGLSGTDNVISCGIFTSNGSPQLINLGWEAQFVLMKTTNVNANWGIWDQMRGMVVGNGDRALYTNTSGAEAEDNQIEPNALGFTAINQGSGQTYIYIAIRRGPMKTPTTGTSVFYPQAVAQIGTPDSTNVPFAPDLVTTFSRNGTDRASNFDQFQIADRLRSLGIPDNSYSNSKEGRSLVTSSQSSEYSANIPNGQTYIQLKADGINITRGGGWNSVSYGDWIYYFMRRAPGFFDVVCYTGTGSAMTVNHNLGVAPEFWIIKARNSVTSGLWFCEYEPSGIGLRLNQDLATVGDYGLSWSATSVTLNSGSFNGSGSTHVMYLFASLPGVSKVGSYTGNGSSQTINCGFTGGARFVLIKRTDSTGDWYVWDSARGIVAANDPHLSLNSTAAEVTTNDSIDPDNSGFIVNQVAATNINVSSATYIYLAIA